MLVVSSNAGTPFSEIGATGVRWWLQAYLPADRTLAEPMLERAVEAGAEAVVLTVDTPVVATKYAAGEEVVWDVIDPALLRVNFDPGYDDRPGAEKATDLGPHDLGWLAEVTGLPVVVKGVLRADDARRCVTGRRKRDLGLQPRRPPARPGRDHGVRARRGGGEAADGAEVYVDGGVRSGLDVLAALALGADAVFLGRPPVWSLVEGEAGVAQVARASSVTR